LNTMPTFETINATCNILDKQLRFPLLHWQRPAISYCPSYWHYHITTCTTEDINDWMDGLKSFHDESIQDTGRLIVLDKSSATWVTAHTSVASSSWLLTVYQWHKATQTCQRLTQCRPLSWTTWEEKSP